jgi:hypothetical protein
MPDGYCEPEDVRTALQETSLSGPTNASIITDDIAGVSSWLRKQSGRHWYDSGGASSDPVPTDARSASTVRLDVPSSPHAQRDQIHRHERGVRYPVTQDGPYARMPLPHGFVDTLNTLEIRDRAGGVEDWVASNDYDAGRGKDYYVQCEDREGYGRSYLYVRAASIGARRDFDGLVTAGYDYGLDAQTETWDDVRRGVALLTAAQVVVDDNVLTNIPDSGQLIGVDTQAERLVDRGMTYLEPYL